MALANKAIPLKTRVVAWACSAIIGVSVYIIFLGIFGHFGGPQGLSSRGAALATIIGMVAGTGSFALVFVNWLMEPKAAVASQESAPSTEDAGDTPEESAPSTWDADDTPPDGSATPL